MLNINYVIINDFEWPLILLALDGYSPIPGRVRIHMICFIYHHMGFNFIPGFFGPYSPELDKAIDEGIARGLIDTYYVPLKYGRSIKNYSLTIDGRRVANAIVSKIRDRYVLLDNVAFIKGKEILSDLEAIKRTYREKPLLFLFQKISEDTIKEWPYWMRFESKGLKEILNEVYNEIKYGFL